MTVERSADVVTVKEGRFPNRPPFDGGLETAAPWVR